MKIIQEPTKPKPFEQTFTCGCTAVLGLGEGDLFRGSDRETGGGLYYYAAFRCPFCKTVHRVDGFAGNADRLGFENDGLFYR